MKIEIIALQCFLVSIKKIWPIIIGLREIWDFPNPIWLAIIPLLDQQTTMMAKSGLGSFSEYLNCIAANQVENCIERKSKLRRFKYIYSYWIAGILQRRTTAMNPLISLAATESHRLLLPIALHLLLFANQFSYWNWNFACSGTGKFISDPGFMPIVIYSTHFTIPNVHFTGQICSRNVADAIFELIRNNGCCGKSLATVHLPTKSPAVVS